MPRTDPTQEEYIDKIKDKLENLEPIKSQLILIVLEALNDAMSPLKILNTEDRIVGLAAVRDYVDYLIEKHADRKVAESLKKKEGAKG